MLLTLVALSGHVKLNFLPGQPGPIRNANSATGDGAASVNGGCGGNAAFGANGKGIIQDGDTVTLNINYAAGHRSAQNVFRMAYACGDGSAASIEAATAKLTSTANACTAKAGGVTAAYGPDGVAAPNAIITGGYEVTCTLPLQNVAAATPCTLALVDQRNWGGCVDVDVLAAAAALPPAPPPSPFVSN